MGIVQTAVNTLSRARGGIALVAVVYGLAAILGWSFPQHFQFLEAQITTLVQQFAHLGAWEFIFRVFVHNLLICYVASCLVALFGLVPLFLAATNGLLIGWLFTWLQDATWYELTAMLAPHGVFELPAMFIALGVGFWRGWGYRGAPEPLGWWGRVKRAHCVFLVFVLPLLLVAAIIEGRYHLMGLIS